MTYNDFLNQFVGVISSFVSWLTSVSNVLIHNYFFITIFGLVMFCSLFWLVYHIFSDTIKHFIYGYDDYNNLYDYYVLKKQVQSDYLNDHYNDEYDLKYRYRVLDLQVRNGVYQNNYDLIKDNKIHNLQLNIDALKELKRINLLDNDDSNDDDVDMIVPNPPVNIASVSELKPKNKNIFVEYPYLHKELVAENNALIDDILKKNEYLYQKHPEVKYLDEFKEQKNEIVDIDSELSTRPISDEAKYNFLKNNPEFLSNDWVISDKGYAINKDTGEVIEM